MKPTLGQKVYILYETFMVCETVEMLGKDSFATPMMFSSIIREEYRLPIEFNEYGKSWFNSLADAKKYLESYDEVAVKRAENYWEIERK